MELKEGVAPEHLLTCPHLAAPPQPAVPASSTQAPPEGYSSAYRAAALAMVIVYCPLKNSRDFDSLLCH